jgi:ankyrin repeat protein
LIAKGANLETTDNFGTTALDYARENNRREVVRLLERVRSPQLSGSIDR